MDFIYYFTIFGVFYFFSIYLTGLIGDLLLGISFLINCLACFFALIGETYFLTESFLIDYF